MDNLDKLEKELRRLTFFKSFSVLETFKIVSGGKGYITPKDIHDYCGYGSHHAYEHHHGDYYMYWYSYDNSWYRFGREVIEFWSNWEDDEEKLAFDEWNQVMMGHSVPENFKAPEGLDLFKRKFKVNAIR